jgi:sulfate transport system substrate-binding protein
MARHADTFHTIALFSVDEVFGGWKKAQKDHFDEGAQFDRLMAASGRR